MTPLSEGAVGTIARALVKDRRALSESLEFWRTRPPPRCLQVDPLTSINSDLQENAEALIELASNVAPWLKQHPEWHLFRENLPIP